MTTENVNYIIAEFPEVISSDPDLLLKIKFTNFTNNILNIYIKNVNNNPDLVGYSYRIYYYEESNTIEYYISNLGLATFLAYFNNDPLLQGVATAESDQPDWMLLRGDYYDEPKLIIVPTSYSNIQIIDDISSNLENSFSSLESFASILLFAETEINNNSNLESFTSITSEVFASVQVELQSKILSYASVAVKETSRAKLGFITKGSKAVNLVTESEDFFDSIDKFRQGVEIRDIRDLTDYLIPKFRSNSDYILTLDSRDIDRKKFDDSIFSIFKSNDKSLINLEINNRISQRLTHESEERDLGQLDIFNTPYPWQREDIITATNPIEVLESKKIPEEIIYKTRPEDLDGRIDVFRTRYAIVLTETDPKVNGSTGIMTNIFSPSESIANGFDTYEFNNLDSSKAYFEDNKKYKITASKINPFKDWFNDREKLLKNNLTNNSLIENILIDSGSFTNTNSAEDWEINFNVGFIRESSLRVDSVVYSGLLRG
jgi:hypothetical protein